MTQAVQTILVVDDHSVIRRSLRIAIQAMGEYNVIEAQDGNEAYEFLKRNECQLIFCDLNMPLGDGLSLIGSMAKINCEAALVLMSGEEVQLLESAQVLAAKHGLHVLDIIEKPVSAARINQLISLVKLQKRPVINESQPELSVKQLKEVLDNGHLKAYFQPQLCLTSYTICGLEALARIEHPELGIIPPVKFIDLAESTGLMSKLTMQMIAHAFGCMRQWQSMGHDMNISVNLSASIMEDAHFPQRLLELVERYGLTPEKVTCELTESILADDPFSILRNMIRLRMMKFKLSIDDFGTGFASMEQLHEMPLQELKLDRSFICDIAENPRSASIVKSNLQLAQALSMETMAEGVEDAKTLQILAQLGCNACQGYYIAPPLPARDIGKFIDSFHQHPAAVLLKETGPAQLADQQA